MSDGLTVQHARGSNGLIPIGGIIMWSGTVATIPANWQLCNGTNGTPDLRDKFIVGVKQDDSGVAKTNLTGSLTQSGGSVSHHHADHAFTQPGAHAAHTHTGPSHQHNLTGGAATAHNHTYTQTVDHVHVQNAPTSASGGAVLYALDTNASGSTSAGISTANPTGSAGATGTTANNTAGATDNAGTGATGDPSASLTHSGGAVDAHDTLSAPMPYFALAFIQRMS